MSFQTSMYSRDNPEKSKPENKRTIRQSECECETCENSFESARSRSVSRSFRAGWLSLSKLFRGDKGNRTPDLVTASHTL